MAHVKTVYPYLHRSIWVFDDPATGLKEEAFVEGMTEIISRLVDAKGTPNASAGFSLHFSDLPFDDHDAVMEAGAADMGGAWYRGLVAGEQMEGWLCPALFLYFEQAPPRLYVKAEPLPAGVQPIWDATDAVTKQFMGADHDSKGYLAYQIDADGNLSDDFLIDESQEISTEAKALIRKKLVNLGLPAHKIDVFMKYVR